MCGIVAYVGHRQAHEVIIKGLKRLEYRGYDSTGIALLNDGLNIYKKKGKVAENVSTALLASNTKTKLAQLTRRRLHRRLPSAHP